MGIKLSLFLALMLLLPHFHCVDWQGTGVMSDGMMSTIWQHINNFNLSKPQSVLIDSADTTIIDFTQGLTADLESRFDRGWNVVVTYIRSTTNADTVLYGYAFRDHWFWYNGLKMNDGRFVSFVVWKDYNCVTYITYNYNLGALQGNFPTA